MDGSRVPRLGVLIGLALALLVIVPQLLVYTRYNEFIYDDVEEVPAAPVAIVFGAGLKPDGSPSRMLADRVMAAVDLFQSGKVEILLMSGDSSSSNYDEVTAMKQLAITLGVPASRIYLDHAGLRTYDTSYRAKSVFGINEAILVSQGYHLPRALYFANSFGIKAVGWKAGGDQYAGQAYYNLREAASLALAWYEVNVIRHGPRYLDNRAGLDIPRS